MNAPESSWRSVKILMNLSNWSLSGSTPNNRRYVASSNLNLSRLLLLISSSTLYPWKYNSPSTGIFLPWTLWLPNTSDISVRPVSTPLPLLSRRPLFTSYSVYRFWSIIPEAVHSFTSSSKSLLSTVESSIISWLFMAFLLLIISRIAKRRWRYYICY